MASTQIATQKTNELSVQGAQTLVNSVKDGLKLVSQGYLAITPDVAKLYDCKGFKALGYKNFDELCTMEFGMSHGTTVGIRKVFDKFGSITKENKYIIPEKYLAYGYTKLLLFTDKKFVETGIDPIAEFTPEMTISEMKDVLKARLEDKAEKQDKSAIDTTAEDVSHETSDDSEKSIIDNSESAETTAEIDVKQMLANIIAEVQEVEKLVNLKPEKQCLFEGVVANLKEIRKSIK